MKYEVQATRPKITFNVTAFCTEVTRWPQLCPFCFCHQPLDSVSVVMYCLSVQDGGSRQCGERKIPTFLCDGWIRSNYCSLRITLCHLTLKMAPRVTLGIYWLLANSNKYYLRGDSTLVKSFAGCHGIREGLGGGNLSYSNKFTKRVLFQLVKETSLSKCEHAGDLLTGASAIAGLQRRLRILAGEADKSVDLFKTLFWNVRRVNLSREVMNKHE